MTIAWVAVLTALIIALVFYIWLAGKPAEEETVEAWSGLDFTPRAGFIIESLPKEEILSTSRVRLIDGYIAELEYRIDPQWTGLLRVAVDTGHDISGHAEDTFETVQVTTIEDVEVTMYHNHGGPELACWTKEGFRYSLYFPQTEPTLMGGMIDNFVLETNAVLTA